jgi:hypothetical protein
MNIPDTTTPIHIYNHTHTQEIRKAWEAVYREYGHHWMTDDKTWTGIPKEDQVCTLTHYSYLPHA